MSKKKGNPRKRKRNRRRSWDHKKYCCYCKRPLSPPPGKYQKPASTSYSKDHVIPKSMGGRKTVPCCTACNQLKGHMMPGQWRVFTNDNPNWWLLWNSDKGIMRN